MTSQNNSFAKPFIRWAGGKGQLIKTIEMSLPKSIHDNSALVYVEPFIGGGAVLFWILQKFPNIDHAVINDMNSDLISTYSAVKKQPHKLVQALSKLETEYNGLRCMNDRMKYYLEKRQEFNERRNNNG